MLSQWLFKTKTLTNSYFLSIIVIFFILFYSVLFMAGPWCHGFGGFWGGGWMGDRYDKVLRYSVLCGGVP